jgi:RimJ/RimL family protein N-acetyltransferase
MHADPSVMQFMPRLLGAEECNALVAHNLRHFREHGFGLWSIEVVGVRPYLGYAGLLRTSFEAPFTPCVEIAWMLARDGWGHGYAVEAAAAVIQRAFGELGLTEIVSFTVPSNTRSRRVMERLGSMSCTGSAGRAGSEPRTFEPPQRPETKGLASR